MNFYSSCEREEKQEVDQKGTRVYLMNKIQQSAGRYFFYHPPTPLPLREPGGTAPVSNSNQFVEWTPELPEEYVSAVLSETDMLVLLGDV